MRLINSFLLITGIGFFLQLLSCKPVYKEESYVYKVSEGNASFFTKNYPGKGTQNFCYSCTLIRDYAEKGKLLNFEKGNDSLSIRIWYYSSPVLWNIFEYVYKEGKFTGQFIKMQQENNAMDSTSILYKRVKRVTTNEDIASFNIYVKESKLLSLPSDTYLKNYTAPHDGTMILVEYATNTEYRIFSYNSPDMNERLIPEAKQLMDAVRHIEKRFSVNFSELW